MIGISRLPRSEEGSGTVVVMFTFGEGYVFRRSLEIALFAHGGELRLHFYILAHISGRGFSLVYVAFHCFYSKCELLLFFRFAPFLCAGLGYAHVACLLFNAHPCAAPVASMLLHCCLDHASELANEGGVVIYVFINERDRFASLMGDLFEYYLSGFVI